MAAMNLEPRRTGVMPILEDEMVGSSRSALLSCIASGGRDAKEKHGEFKRKWAQKGGFATHSTYLWVLSPALNRAFSRSFLPSPSPRLFVSLFVGMCGISL